MSDKTCDFCERTACGFCSNCGAAHCEQVHALEIPDRHPLDKGETGLVCPRCAPLIVRAFIGTGTGAADKLADLALSFILATWDRAYQPRLQAEPAEPPPTDPETGLRTCDLVLKTPFCPDCGKVAKATLETKPAQSLLDVDEETGHANWNGQTEDEGYESETNKGPHGRPMLVCEDEHEWEDGEGLKERPKAEGKT